MSAYSGSLSSMCFLTTPYIFFLFSILNGHFFCLWIHTFFLPSPSPPPFIIQLASSCLFPVQRSSNIRLLFHNNLYEINFQIFQQSNFWNSSTMQPTTHRCKFGCIFPHSGTLHTYKTLCIRMVILKIWKIDDLLDA